MTGSTGGIGKGIALELARKGQNVVLISRSQGKLDAVEKEVQALGVQTKTIAIDFTNFDTEAQDKVMKVCKDLDVGCLVNNVGLSYPYPQYFQDADMSRLVNICKVNCEALVAMTRLLLPQMQAKKRGTVVNMSSIGGVVPHQLMVVYGSSKAFVNNFTINMQNEAGSSGVTFSAQMPMYVVSNMSKIKRSSLFIPTATAYAKAAVKHFGYSGLLSPYWSHTFYAGALGQLPWAILDPIIAHTHKSIRKRALRKYNKTK